MGRKKRDGACQLLDAEYNLSFDARRDTAWSNEILGTYQTTTFRLDNFCCFLTGLKLEKKFEHIVFGFKKGFRIQYKGDWSKTINHSPIPESIEAKQKLAEYIQRELTIGRLLGPFNRAPEILQPIKTSPVSLIPKKTMGVAIPGKYRMIHNASSGKLFGNSVNCGISDEDSTVTYTSFENVLTDVRAMGRNCTLFKTDLVEAFKLVPVSPIDIPLLGFIVKKQYYIESRLVFGIRTGPRIFGNVAAAVKEIFASLADCPLFKNMLDDFFAVENANSLPAAKMLKETFGVFLTALGIEASAEKTEGPSTKMVILGLEIDTEKMIVSVPPPRMVQLANILAAFENKTVVSKEELQRMIGILNFCSYGVKHGRTFQRRLIDKMATLYLQTEECLLDDETKNLKTKNG
jgi:hypothetical protein